LDLGVRFPRVQLTLEPLDALGLRLLLHHPRYRSGTSTQALQREHFALTWPVGASTLRMALWMTTSCGSFTTTLARHTGQRRIDSSAASVISRLSHGQNLPIVDRDCQETMTKG